MADLGFVIVMATLSSMCEKKRERKNSNESDDECVLVQEVYKGFLSPKKKPVFLFSKSN